MGPRCLILLGLLPALAGPPSSGSLEDIGGRSSEYTQIHMGVPVRIVAHGPEEGVRAAAAAAFGRIAVLDRMMSDYRPDSAVRALGEEWMQVPPELFLTIRHALNVARATNGAFDPSIGPVVSLWREARRSKALPDPEALEAARRRTGWRRIELDPARHAVRIGPAMSLDLGGVAKGFILQEGLRTLRSHGTARALIEAGGDIVVGDAPPGRDGWHIDVPGAGAGFATRAHRLTNAALATSGPTVQFVEIGGIRYSHVVDPRTGLGVTTDRVAHVIAAEGAIADALATAIAVLGPEAIPRVRARFPGTFMTVVDRRSARVPRAGTMAGRGAGIGARGLASPARIDATGGSGPHSIRRAVTGSRRVARRAGT